MVFSKSLDEIGEGYVRKYMLYISNTHIIILNKRQWNTNTWYIIENKFMK